MLERTIYGLADLNGDGVIDFPEFIIAVCVLCTYSKDQVRPLLLIQGPSVAETKIWGRGFEEDGGAVAGCSCLKPQVARALPADS